MEVTKFDSFHNIAKKMLNLFEVFNFVHKEFMRQTGDVKAFAE